MTSEELYRYLLGSLDGIEVGDFRSGARTFDIRVRNKKVTYYCYSEEERDLRAKELGKAEITRFKGLGEISPKEFGQFIGKDIRLEQVTIDHTKGIHEMLKFYMGDNTPERKEYIMNNLEVVDYE